MPAHPATAAVRLAVGAALKVVALLHRGARDAVADPDDDGADLDYEAPQTLTLRDSTGYEWSLGTIGPAAPRLYWVGADSTSMPERRALPQAFIQAAFYDGALRAATSTSQRSPSSPLRYAVRRQALRSGSTVP